METKTASKGDIKTIHALLARISKADDKEFKQMLVGQYTNYRETSTTQLRPAEASEMIGDLQRMTGWTKSQILANEKRRLMLHYAHEMLWVLPNGKVDVERVSDWAEKYGYLHKSLNDHTVEELSQLVYQFQKVYQSYLKSV